MPSSAGSLVFIFYIAYGASLFLHFYNYSIIFLRRILKSLYQMWDVRWLASLNKNAETFLNLGKDIKMGQLPQDPIMLYSVINTKLRDFYSSLEVLCEDMGLSEEELKEKLSSAGFEYDKDRNQFI